MADQQPARLPDPGERSDAVLWAACCAGDADAFDVVYDRHVEAVHGVLARRVGAQDAADLTAEVFTRAWAHRDRIRPAQPGGLRPWLLGTALNIARGHTERAGTAERLAHRLAEPGTVDDPAAEVIDAVDDAAALPRAQAALASLSTSDQELLVLCVLEGVPPAQAAIALGQPAATVRSRLTRARRRLAGAFDKASTGGEQA